MKILTSLVGFILAIGVIDFFLIDLKIAYLFEDFKIQYPAIQSILMFINNFSFYHIDKINIIFQLILVYGASKKERLVRLKIHWFYLILTICVTSIWVNVVLKKQFLRPRPRHIIDLPSDDRFQTVYETIFKKNEGLIFIHQSFSSGHASLAVNPWVTIYFARMNGVYVSKFLGFLSVFWFILVSIFRIYDKGHFFSDTLASFFFSFWFAFCYLKLQKKSYYFQIFDKFQTQFVKKYGLLFFWLTLGFQILITIFLSIK